MMLTTTEAIKLIRPSSARSSMSTNSPAKKTSVPHSTFSNTASMSWTSARTRRVIAPNMAIQPNRMQRKGGVCHMQSVAEHGTHIQLAHIHFHLLHYKEAA